MLRMPKGGWKIVGLEIGVCFGLRCAKRRMMQTFYHALAEHTVQLCSAKLRHKWVM